MRNFMLATCLLLIPVLSTGCNRGDGPPLAPASGKVTLDGIPVEGASVSFEPVNGGRPCSGMTNAEGIYQITSVQTNDGAPVGDHYVAIIKITGEGASVPAGTDPSMALSDIPAADSKDGKKEPETIYLVPRKYNVAKTSGLKVTVPSGGSSELNFELSAR
jgi:hypothetical protein